MALTEITYSSPRPPMAPRRVKRAPVKRKRRTKAKLSKVGLLRSYGILDGTWMRYSGLKGIYWYFFSKWIKKRDYEQHDGKCITCLEYVAPEEARTCHTFAAQGCGFALLFHPLNNHMGHSKCNNHRFNPDAPILDALHVEERYGVGTIKKLQALKKQKTTEWSKEEYKEKIKELL